MTQTGVPVPSIATPVAIVVEFFVALAVAIGVWTRPLALLLALYTLVTALIAHHFWTMEGAERYENAINFYKNISIIGGFLLLYVSGAGRYSVDARLIARRVEADADTIVTRALERSAFPRVRAYWVGTKKTGAPKGTRAPKFQRQVSWCR